MSYKIISKSYTDCLLYPQKTADITPPFITYRQEPSFAASLLCRFAASHRQYGLSASSPYSRYGVIGIL